jgi:hypothetical protein
MIRISLWILAFVILVSTNSYAEDSACSSNVDACVLCVIAETATFIAECGAEYPQHKAGFDSAFRDWSVLKLSIPGLDEALDEKSPLRISMREAIVAYFKRIPAQEKDIECVGRLEMVRNPKPTLRGDSATLPPNALDKYAK